MKSVKLCLGLSWEDADTRRPELAWEHAKKRGYTAVSLYLDSVLSNNSVMAHIPEISLILC